MAVFARVQKVEVGGQHDEFGTYGSVMHLGSEWLWQVKDWCMRIVPG